MSINNIENIKDILGHQNNQPKNETYWVNSSWYYTGSEIWEYKQIRNKKLYNEKHEEITTEEELKKAKKVIISVDRQNIFLQISETQRKIVMLKIQKKLNNKRQEKIGV